MRYSAEELDRLKSETDWAKVDATTRQEIERQADADDGPLPEGWEDTVVLGIPAPKRGVYLRLDPHMLDWFKARGAGYQTHINAVLRAFVQAKDTNIVSDLVRHPQGRIADHISRVGEAQVCTSIIVAAELRNGAAKRGAPRLTTQLETVLGALDVLAFEAPADAAYGLIRTRLEQQGRPIGGNDLLIAAQAVALGYTIVTDNEGEFARVEGLPRENWLRSSG